MAEAATTSTGWYPVARAPEVGTAPVAVDANGHAYVVVRTRPRGEVTAYPTRYPDRIMPLPWAVEERHGWIWLAPERTALPLPAPPHQQQPGAVRSLRPRWAVEPLEAMAGPAIALLLRAAAALRDGARPHVPAAPSSTAARAG